MSEALPKDVPSSETLLFLSRFPAGDRPRVLEVGCATGDVAMRLGQSH